MRRAFTLIELLVVVSIIALLIAILLPVLMRTKEATHRVQCVGNLHQFYTGVLNYSLENDGYYPDGARDTGTYHTRYLSTRMYEYVLESTGGNKAIFACPSQDAARKADGATYVRPTDTPPNGLGWRLNGYVHLGGFDFTSWTNTATYPVWNSILRMDDASADQKIIVDFSYQSGPGVSNPTVGMHSPKGFLQEPATAGRLTPEGIGIEGGNIAMADGAVRWKNISEMQPYSVHPPGGAWNWH